MHSRASLPFVLGSVVLLGACTAAAPPLDARVPSARSLRIATYNLNYGLSQDAQGIAAIRATDADVLLLQEVTPGWQRALRRELGEEYPHQRHHPHAAAGGVSVLSRFEVLDDELVDNPVSWFPAQRTVVDTPLGSVQLLNVHLRPPFDDDGSVVKGYFTTRSIRDEEVRLFLAALAPGFPTVVAGDFNEPEGPASSRLVRAGLRDVLPRFAPGETTWRWPVPVLGSVTDALDHLYVTSDLCPVDAWVVHEGRSDHFPVVGWFEAC